MGTSATCFNCEHVYENTRASGNAFARTDGIWKQNEITESARSLNFDNESFLQRIYEDNSCSRNDENDKRIPQISEPDRQTETSDTISKVPLGSNNGRMYIGTYQANRYPRDVQGTCFVKKRRYRLRQTTIPDLQEEKMCVVDNEHQNVGQEEQISHQRHRLTPDADNVLYKYICPGTGANDREKRNSYEWLNKDTMEPQGKVCQCKAHPKRVKSKRFSTTCEGQMKTVLATCPGTSPLHPHIEAICQRTAAIILQQMRSDPKPIEHEMVDMPDVHKHVDARGGLDTVLGDFAIPNEDENIRDYTVGGFDQGNVQSIEARRRTGVDIIVETSLSNIPIHGRGDLEQDTQEGEKEVEYELYEWEDSNELSGIEHV